MTERKTHESPDETIEAAIERGRRGLSGHPEHTAWEILRLEGEDAEKPDLKYAMVRYIRSTRDSSALTRKSTQELSNLIVEGIPHVLTLRETTIDSVIIHGYPFEIQEDAVRQVVGQRPMPYTFITYCLIDPYRIEQKTSAGAEMTDLFQKIDKYISEDGSQK